MLKRFPLIFFPLMLWFFLVKASEPDFNKTESRNLVVMRMIGHEYLKATGDSTTRILPVVRAGERYKIAFEKPFVLEPEVIAHIIDSLVEVSGIATAYSMEVTDCDSGAVVYGLVVQAESDEKLIPCRGRSMPKDCYIFYFQILESPPAFDPAELNAQLPVHSSVVDQNDRNSRIQLLIILISGVFVLTLIYFLHHKRKSRVSHLIPIGSFLFDHRNMKLIKGKERQDLTGKESDLLHLLHGHLNSTVDRDIILKEVWQDDGAYLGRTLDVYISKLRKKFSADPAISIINVRGVGYKMTLK